MWSHMSCCLWTLAVFPHYKVHQIEVLLLQEWMQCHIQSEGRECNNCWYHDFPFVSLKKLLSNVMWHGVDNESKCFYQESNSLGEDNYKKPVNKLSRDEERLQQFAQVFLTMRQIANQQQRAQSAPPFPPSHGSPYIVTSPPHTPPTEVCSVVEEQCCVMIEHPSTPPPTSATQFAPKAQPRVSLQGTDVVLDMTELLKTLEQYCDGEDLGCSSMLLDGDIESNQRWGVQKNGYKKTSASPLKHLRLPDVNAVLIVLVAMVIYTKTVCRDAFFGTRQSHRKH